MLAPLALGCVVLHDSGGGGADDTANRYKSEQNVQSFARSVMSLSHASPAHRANQEGNSWTRFAT